MKQLQDEDFHCRLSKPLSSTQTPFLLGSLPPLPSCIFTASYVGTDSFVHIMLLMHTLKSTKYNSSLENERPSIRAEPWALSRFTV